MKRLLLLGLLSCGQLPVVVDAGGGPKGTACSFSTSKNGSFCQVNFFCPDGGDQGVFCGSASDGGFDCACGPVAANPRRFVPEMSFCTDVVSNPASRAGQANVGCLFNLPL